MQTFQVVMALVVIWQTILTILAIYIFRHFRRLSKGISTGNLITVIDKLIDIEENNSESVNKVGKRIDRLEIENLENIQKVGFIRFNPFQELGGDHSFSVALLNGKDSGFVFTGLHSRDRTRVYSKEIEQGQSKIDLSEEENKALDKALKR